MFAVSMSHKKSASATQKNKPTWTRNLVRFQESHKKRRAIPLEEHSLENNSRIPLKIQIVGRYLFLGATVKGRKERVKEIAKEVSSLWQNKLNCPKLSSQVTEVKLDKVLKTYDECVKRGKYDLLDEVFDITKENGEWLCSDDKKLYYLQIESKGQIGYTTGKAVNSKTIHPSKRRKILQITSTTAVATPKAEQSTSESNTVSEYEESDNPEEHPDEPSTSKSRKYSKTETATKLVTLSKLSTSKAANIRKQLSQDGIDIDTPSQSGVYKSTITEALKLKENMKKHCN